MKQITLILLLFVTINTYGQDSPDNYNKHTKCLIDAGKEKALKEKNLYNKYFYTPSVPPGSTLSAAYGDRCRAHNKAYCPICSKLYHDGINAISIQYHKEIKQCDEQDKAAKTSIELALEEEEKKKEDLIKSYKTTNKNSPIVKDKGISKGMYMFFYYQFLGTPNETTGIDGKFYVSDVIDVSKLNCDYSSYDPHGTWAGCENCYVNYNGTWGTPLPNKYIKCGADWFNKKLASQFNITDPSTSTWIYVTCILNEVPCSTSNEEECIIKITDGSELRKKRADIITRVNPENLIEIH